MSVATALESDLEPFHKLRRFVLKPPVSSALTYPPTIPAAHHFIGTECILALFSLICHRF
jgi:hypothetical protein